MEFEWYGKHFKHTMSDKKLLWSIENGMTTTLVRRDLIDNNKAIIIPHEALTLLKQILGGNT